MRTLHFNKNAISSFIVGIIFGVGLVISGMTQPQKVIGFLDFFGNWDLSLIFVMAGAILVHAIFYPLIMKKKHPMFDTQFHVPIRRDITSSLIIGSVIFGIGWGLGGYCPGPAFASLISLDSKVLVFIVNLLIGMKIYHLIENKLPFKK